MKRINKQTEEEERESEEHTRIHTQKNCNK
jgi:hypothetical protein